MQSLRTMQRFDAGHLPERLASILRSLHDEANIIPFVLQDGGTIKAWSFVRVVDGGLANDLEYTVGFTQADVNRIVCMVRKKFKEEKKPLDVFA